ncbi:hypothetical protein [Teichococcus aestuarii]|uniref:hypothetical protein n=1 Tax=Teichococcus aestuarii TaxID=568898 RepID=UPI0036154630
MAKVARDLGITRAAVATWKRVPDNRLAQVAEATGIPAHCLRPDLACAFEAKVPETQSAA